MGSANDLKFKQLICVAPNKWFISPFDKYGPQDELPAEQVAVLRKAFEAFDSQKSGSIPCDMVADILRIMGQPFDKKILEELIEEVDADKSGRLEFEEFVTLAAKFIVEEDDEAMQKELKEAFRLYDKEGNGYIPTSCLREILRELDDQLTDRELDMMIEEIDTDGSGTVDFDEFMEMMTGEV
ncbi:troponin C-like isoform X4 [Rhynchophorus ferrugineus]|uniref:troponin C-like isoform X4 n=1 Tax=Rhynchophorus ferrugineus TaxID=354439 RepID=UPI003FCD56E6